MLDAVQMPGRHQVHIDRSRDVLLTDFGRATLSDRYLMPGEEFQDLFARVASYYGDDAGHAQRIYDYMSKLWFMPATPVLSNGGTQRGLPISCFLNEASDSLEGIVGLWNENVWLASKGGGIGSYWGNLRSIGEKVGAVGKTSGVIPFIRVMDSLTLAISQGSLRRGSAAVYLPVSHPEIEEFVEIRRPTGGDPNRKALNLHHGILVSDAFMRAVEADEQWALLSPKDETVGALDLRPRALDPHPHRADRDRRALPDLLRPREPRPPRAPQARRPGGEDLEPVLRDHAADRPRPARHGAHRGLLPVLAEPGELVRVAGPSDLHRGRHAVPRQRAAGLHRPRARRAWKRRSYSAMRERSVGLGVMGFHSFLQAQNVPFESVIAKVWNKRMFKHIRAQADRASRVLAEERGAVPRRRRVRRDGALQPQDVDRADRVDFHHRRQLQSPGIEPIAANVFLHKTLSGSFTVRNRHLQRLLAEKGMDNDEVWSSITQNAGQRAAPGLPDRAGEGGLQDRVRTRPALDHRARRRPRAVHLPEPVGQRLPARQRA